ncbi:MAG: hypothetical protein LH475_03230 [Cryobacterium sp.]|uniref:hypothetical protein n=1 Tax=unclassified Cryobacterium TaxID=2649013 RepID=UPI0018CB021E|nr:MULTISPECIES: hypothetical protein [unclassified Cryobacterium]MCY7403637.1 hypothetical protein [Cryobacterium sp.]MEC5155622.1 membrane protein YdbS with pleckstrin-like domain [Cryobacterium sp. CAN_C3]
MSESQRVFDQRPLTTSTGAIWLVVGGALTLLCGALLFAMQWLSPAGVATTGLVIVVALYAAMVVIRFAVSRKRLKLGILATLTLLIVMVFLICGGIVTVTEWGAVSTA